MVLGLHCCWWVGGQGEGGREGALLRIQAQLLHGLCELREKNMKTNGHDERKGGRRKFTNQRGK